MTRRRLSIATFVPIAACVLLAGTSVFACVPQARLVSLSPRASGAPGSEVRVDVLAFDTGPAEVRWNAPDGPQLATSTGPNFSATVTIPDVAAGLYSIVVLSRAPGGAVGNAGAAAFQVTGKDGGGHTGPGESATGAGRSYSSSRESPESSSSPFGLLALGGVVLLLLGALGGRFLSVRRSRR